MSKFIGKRRTAGMVAILVAAIAGASAYAFTASNTVTAHSAGVGEAAVTGYTVTSGSESYTYSLNGLYVIAVSFALNAAANDVAASVDGTAATTTWVDCGATVGAGPYVATCNFKTGAAPTGGGVLSSIGTGWPIATATKLTVAAVEDGSVTLG